MNLRSHFSALLLTAVVAQSALAEPSGLDALAGEWKSVDSPGTSDKSPERETTLSVKKDHQFDLRRKISNPPDIIVYKGVISEIKGQLIAEVILGPVICGPTAPSRDWPVSIEKDKLTVSYSDGRKETFVRSAKPPTAPGEQDIAPNDR